MGLHDDINLDLKTAIKAQDRQKATVLRGLKAAIKNKQVELRQELSEDQIRTVIASEIKKGKEAIEQFSQGSRNDLVKKQEAEIEILSGYLPPQLTVQEIKEIVARTIEDLSAGGPQDLGKVMKAVMPKVAGRADGREVNRLTKELLS